MRAPGEPLRWDALMAFGLGGSGLPGGVLGDDAEGDGGGDAIGVAGGGDGGLGRAQLDALMRRFPD